VYEHENRDGELGKSWDINPDGFMLMAACQSDQKAASEASDMGVTIGTVGPGTEAQSNHLQPHHLARAAPPPFLFLFLP
jgi:hypothetical protein